MATNLKDAEGGHPLGRVVGDLFGLSLPEMVQMLSLGGRTGKVSITSESGSGQLWFVDGSATHAESGDKTGTVAFHEMLRWKSGRFVIEDKERADVQTLHGDTMLIVLDG